MGGDWVVTVTAIDGVTNEDLIQTRFNMLVDSDLPICGNEQATNTTFEIVEDWGNDS